MDKIFDVEIDGQVILPDGRKLGPFEETTVNVVQPSEGGSDPVVENAKETGGIGWTEQGEQTVITWDGDPTGKDSFLNTYYKVSDLTPTESTISNGEVVFSHGPSGTVGSGVELGDIAMMYIEGGIIIATSSGQIVTEDITIDIPSAGMYFMKEDSRFITSLTYGTPDTVHTIDSKYLGGGGAMVVHFSADGEGVVSDKTVEDVRNMLRNGPVVGIFDIGDGDIFGYFMTVFYNGEKYLGCCCTEIHDAMPYANPFIVSYDGETWETA